jgi:peptidoglycan/LPS O-acetylase OafA/YrhL
MLAPTDNQRIDYLDAVRAFALLLGIVFHASLSFLPIFIGWAVMDVSTSPVVSAFMLVSHSFRMELFFLIAGFFSHLTYHRKGAGFFVRSRILRLVVPFLIGWFILKPLIVSGWVMGGASLRGDVDILAGLRGGIQSLVTLPTGLFTGTHLWFLYYLAMVTVATLGIRMVLRASGAWWTCGLERVDALFALLARSHCPVLFIAIPTAAVLWFMKTWGVDTPDQSLRPNIPLLALYGGFFVVGWMLHRNSVHLAALARLTVTRWIIAALSIVAVLTLVWFQIDPGHPHFTIIRMGYMLSYAVMMWSLVFVTIGIFEKLFRRPNAVVRYIADSSYWLYLFHLPVVIWLQVAVAELPVHWSIKLASISTITILLGLLTYDLLVRPTVLGQLLNGRRRNRALLPGRSIDHLVAKKSAVASA